MHRLLGLGKIAGGGGRLGEEAALGCSWQLGAEKCRRSKHIQAGAEYGIGRIHGERKVGYASKHRVHVEAKPGKRKEGES